MIAIIMVICNNNYNAIKDDSHNDDDKYFDIMITTIKIITMTIVRMIIKIIIMRMRIRLRMVMIIM